MEIKRHKDKNYVSISLSHLKDNKLSLKAKGLLSMILSLPDEWDFSVEGLAAICLESKNTLYRILEELETLGYCLKEQLRTDTGFGKVQYSFYEFSLLTDNLNPENQSQYRLDLINTIKEQDPEVLEVIDHNKSVLLSRQEIKRERRKRRKAYTGTVGVATPISPDFQPPDEVTLKARALYPNIDISLQTRNFIDHYSAKGTTAVDWVAKWKLWIRRRDEWDKERASKMVVKPPYSEKSEEKYVPGSFDSEMEKLGLKK